MFINSQDVVTLTSRFSRLKTRYSLRRRGIDPRTDLPTGSSRGATRVPPRVRVPNKDGGPSVSSLGRYTRTPTETHKNLAKIFPPSVL